MKFQALSIAAIAAASLMAASAASAATVINVNPASLTKHTIGTIDAVQTGTTAQTFDWVFNLTAPVGKVLKTEIELTAQKNGNTKKIGFNVFSGAPSLPTSHLIYSGFEKSPTVKLELGTGSYFIEVTSSDIFASGSSDFAVNKETISGNITVKGAVSAAPEPAAWALMMVGVGGMGAALRTRRRKAVAA
jgi:opacity protein-like surface antigen